MPVFLAFLLLLVTTAAMPQTQHDPSVDLSPTLAAHLHLDNPDHVSSSGWITILDTQTHKPLIKVPVTEVTPNEISQPSDLKDKIIYDDFNFDSIKDLAIEDGKNSCYDGPSYQVYLANPTSKQQFEYSKEWTKLTQDEYCGMFKIDKQHQKIQTTAKSDVAGTNSQILLL